MSYEQVGTALKRHGLQGGKRWPGQRVLIIGGVYADRIGTVKSVTKKTAHVELGPIWVYFPHHRLKVVPS